MNLYIPGCAFLALILAFYYFLTKRDIHSRKQLQLLSILLIVALLVVRPLLVHLEIIRYALERLAIFSCDLLSLKNVLSNLFASTPLAMPIEIHGRVVTIMSIPGLFIILALGALFAFALKGRSSSPRSEQAFKAWALWGNFFFSQIEVPLAIMGNLPRLSKGRVFLLMSVGFASCASGTMLLYSMWFEGTVGFAMSEIFLANILAIVSVYILSGLLVPLDTKWKSEGPSEPDSVSILSSFWQGTKAISFSILFVGGLVTAVSYAKKSLESLMPIACSTSYSSTDLNISPIESLLGYVLAVPFWLFGRGADFGKLVGCWLAKELFNNDFVLLQGISAQGSNFSPQILVLALYLFTHFSNLYSLAFQSGFYWIGLPAHRAELPGMLVRAIALAIFSRFLIALVAAVSVAMQASGPFN